MRTSEIKICSNTYINLNCSDSAVTQTFKDKFLRMFKLSIRKRKHLFILDPSIFSRSQPSTYLTSFAGCKWVTCTTFGLRSDPCCMRVPMVNQKLLASENWFSTRWLSTSQGCGLCHSYGENRATTNIVMETKT